MKTKRTLSFILSIIMLASSLMCLPTNAFASDINPEGQVFLNPLFYDEDDIANYEYVQAKTVLSSQAASYSTNVVYNNPTEAAEALRDAMVDRQDYIPIKFYYPKDFDDSSTTGTHPVWKVFDMARSEELSVSAVDGDYMNWIWDSRWFYTNKESIINDKVYCECTYVMAYRTTKEEEQEITDKINHDLPLLNLEGKSEYLKIKKIHDYICESTKYDYEHLDDDSDSYKYTAYGALVLGRCVCAGYAVLFHRLCKEVGLESRVIAGEAEGKGYHAWNIVRIGDLFYNVDVTWDDWENGGYYHKWMLKGKLDFERHIPTGKYATEEFWIPYPMSDYSYVCKHSDNDELVSSAEATCTEQGYKEYYCPLCDENHKEEIVDALGHDYTIVVTEPTCYGYGYTTYTCNRCGYEYTDDWKDPLEHDYIIEVIQPTCSNQGYTIHTCNRCGYSFRNDYVPATGNHNYYVSEKEDPTCYWGGYIEYTCSVCQDYYYEYPDALGHDYTTEIIPPTCSRQGYTIYTCNRCGYRDAFDFVDALGHDYKTEVTPPTCADEGYTTYTCDRCDYSYEDDFVPATGNHNYYVSEKQDPTCYWGGYIEYTCSVCQDYYYEYPDELGHDYKTIVTQPTCGEQGYTTYTCNRCGDYYEDNYVPATGKHKYVANVIYKPTCYINGYTEYECECGAYYSEETPETPHTYKTYTTKATTSRNGTAVTECTVCGTTKSTSTIYYPKTISLSATSYTYDGKVKTPSVKVVGSNGKTISSSNYTVSYASGRKNVGKYAVKITFKGNYSGSKTLYFTINPKGTSVSSLSAGSKKFTVKWKKQSTQTTGYQIQYSTSSKFTNAKTVTVSKNSTTSKSISKLSAKKKYYVRIRTYKKVGSTNYYSSWSKAKYVTTKK